MIEKMMHQLRRIFITISLLCFVLTTYAGQKGTIHYDRNDPMQGFGVNDLKSALALTGHKVVEAESDANMHIILSKYKMGMGPQSFRIQKEGNRGIRIVFEDAAGAMKLAEQISLGGGLSAIKR